MLFEEEDTACEFVLRFGPQVEVVEPAALRALVAQTAARVVALYAEENHSAT